MTDTKVTTDTKHTADGPGSAPTDAKSSNPAADKKTPGLDDVLDVTSENVFVLWSREPLDAVQAHLTKLSGLRPFVRTKFESDGRPAPDQFLAVLLPRVAVALKKQIDRVAAGEQSARCTPVVTHMEPLQLTRWDLPDPRCFTDSFYLRIPLRIQMKHARKHVEDCLELLRGNGLIPTSQCYFDFATTENGRHHRGFCVVRFETREQAERRNARGHGKGAQGDKSSAGGHVKLGGRIREESLLFVRHLLNDYPWPRNIPLLAVDDEEAEEAYVPPFVECKWNKRPNRKQHHE